jgi:hypothetical protein
MSTAIPVVPYSESGSSPSAIIGIAPAAGDSIDILRGIEESAILAAYQQSEKHGIEFGRLCFEYGEKYGAQGSAGDGLAQFLRKSGIKEGRAYYWIAEYKASVGQGIPCEHCSETFPSKTKLKKHLNKAHPETQPYRALAPKAKSIELPTETTEPSEVPAPKMADETDPSAPTFIPKSMSAIERLTYQMNGTVNDVKGLLSSTRWDMDPNIPTLIETAAKLHDVLEKLCAKFSCGRS